MDIDSKEMALLRTIRVVLLQIGCVVIGLSDLSVMIALYFSPLALHHIHPVIAVILITPSMLLIVSATFKIRGLAYPWMNINWIVVFILTFIIFLIGIVAFELKYNVSVAEVAEKVHNFEPLLSNEQPLKKEKLKMIVIYLIGTLTLYFIVLFRMAVVKAFSNSLRDDEMRQQAQVDLPNGLAEQSPLEAVVTV